MLERIEARRKDARLRGAERSLDDAELLMAAAQEQADKEMADAVRQKVRTADNIIARRRLDASVAEKIQAGLRPDEALLSDVVGTAHGVAGGRVSASSKRVALAAQYLAPIHQFFAQRKDLRRLLFGVKALTTREGRAAAKRFNDDIVREMYQNRPDGMPGITGNEDAKQLADLLFASVEEIRTRLNRHGVGIGKVHGWSPQSHHSEKVLRVGRDQWIDQVLPRLDLDRTFPYLNDLDFDPGAWGPDFADMPLSGAKDAVMRRVLGEVYENITTGRVHAPMAARTGQFTGPGNLSNKLTHHRVLHFRSADDWLSYHAEFGRGDVVAGVMNHIERETRALALIEQFGTNPEVMIKSKHAQMIEEINKADMDPVAKRNALRKMKADWRARSGKIVHALAEVRGDTLTPHNLTVAKVMGGARAWIAMTKLGSATISALADLPIAARNLRFQGRSATEAWRDAFKAMLGTKKKRDASLVGAFCEGILGSAHGRFDIADGLPGALSTMQNMFHRMTFLTQWTDNLKAGVTQMHSHYLGQNAGKAWHELSDGLKHALEVHGIDGAKWKIFRRAVTEIDGKAYVMPELVREMPDPVFEGYLRPELARAKQRIRGKAKQWTEAMEDRFVRRRERMVAEARQSLETDLMMYFADEAEYAVITSSDRSRAMMLRGKAPGTAAGEILRLIWQFKSFPVNYMERVWGRALFDQNRTFRQARTNPDTLRDIAFMIAATTAFGYMAMTAKDFTKGKSPRDPAALSTWIAAFTQGGGGGIYGDFLFGQYNRFGGSLAETVAGPVVSGPIGDVAAIWAGIIQGKLSAAKVFRTAWYNTPMVNLWYTKAAMDYMVLYHLEEMMSPGTLRRRERRLKRENNQTYILPPTEVIQRGGGFR